MARRDNTHFIVREALEREGWIVTHDPFFIKLGKKSAEIDLGAERIDDAYEELKNDLFSFPSFEDLHHRIIVYKSENDTDLLWIK